MTVRGGGGQAVLIRTVEGIENKDLSEFRELTGSGAGLAITARRATVLGLPAPKSKVIVLTLADPLDAHVCRELADPLSTVRPAPEDGITGAETSPFDCRAAAVELAKIARLIPAAVTSEITGADADDLDAWAHRHDIILIDAGDIFRHEIAEARTLVKVSEARVPLLDAQETRIHAFRPADGGLEHLAIVIGAPERDKPVLSRVHSECFTGDLLGSLRCDCGDQLQGAIQEIGKEGAGILLYLAQEGRGIGLINKLRAYELQDSGFDTIDANEQLGFDADERIYLPAAQMLRLLGFRQVKLMTNNPDKVTALEQGGITVVERVPHRFPSNKHNEGYLQTKASRSGHLF